MHFIHVYTCTPKYTNNSLMASNQTAVDSTLICNFVVSINGIRFEPHHERTNILVSDLVRHKPSCSATEDG